MMCSSTRLRGVQCIIVGTMKGTVCCCCYFFHSEGEKRWDYSEMKVSIDASIIVDDLKRIFKTKRASISKFISYFEFLIFDRLYLNLILTFVGMIKERMELHS